MERDARRRCERSRNAPARARRCAQHARSPHHDHRRQPYRVWLAEQAGHQRGARRAAGRRRDQAGQAQLRMARGREVPGARRRVRATSTRASASAARMHSEAWEKQLAAVQGQVSARLADEIDRRCSIARIPTAGTRKSRSSPPDRERRVAAATHRRRCSTRSRRIIPWVLGGSADLAPSTKTRLTFEGAGDFEPENRAGRNFHFGIREHAMGAIAQRHGAVQAASLRQRIFDFQRLYARPAIRLAAIMELPSILHLHARLDRRGRRRADASADRTSDRRCARSRDSSRCVRVTPTKWPRPGASIMPMKHQPVCLILSRQNMPTLDRTKYARGRGSCARAPTCWPTRRAASRRSS